VSGKLIVDAVLDRHPWHHVAYVPRRHDLVRYLRQTLRPGDLCLTLGAGDLTSLPDELSSPAAVPA
jgi:UDP-N-acetylmuramate--alanine ligase